jgi:hypothetical protein
MSRFVIDLSVSCKFKLYNRRCLTINSYAQQYSGMLPHTGIYFHLRKNMFIIKLYECVQECKLNINKLENYISPTNEHVHTIVLIRREKNPHYSMVFQGKLTRE